MPLTPTGFNITSQSFTKENVTVTFVWDALQGSGPEAIVDYYGVYIAPSSLSHPDSVAITNTTSIGITVDYNTVYEANLTATNCVGESESTALLRFEYGKPGTEGAYRYTK